MSEDDVARSLIATLAKQGEHVDDGVFTLDPVAAHEKLREHQLADPDGYLLLLVEAAWLAADELERAGVRIELGSTTVVEFDGVALEQGSLRELFSAALAIPTKLEGEPRRRARILQLLGLAANSVLALEPKQIIIEASDANGDGQRATIEPSGALTVEPCEASYPRMVRFTCLGSMRAFGRARAGRKLLEQRCRYTRLPVRVNGQLISQDTEIDLGDGASTVVMLDGRAIGVVGHGKDPHALTSAWIVNRGLAIADSLSIRSPVHALVEVDLPVDISRKQLLHGHELVAVRQAIRDAQMQVSQSRVIRVPNEQQTAARPASATVVEVAVGLLFLALLFLLGLFGCQP